MTRTDCAAVVLAAGKGTRMKSDRPKVLHEVAGLPMIRHVLAALDPVAPERRVVVVAPGMDAVAEAAAPAPTALQREALGTGHAVMAARGALAGFAGDVLILFGDAPLLTAATVRSLLAARRRAPAPAVVALGFRPEAPDGYGRLVAGAGGGLERIVEDRDASEEERRIGLCNGGAMAVDGAVLFPLLEAAGRNRAGGEHYLTDIVAAARARGLGCVVAEAADAREAAGVNSRRELAAAEAAMQERLRLRAMENGATLVDPAAVWLAADAEIGRDVVLGPNVVIGPGARIGDRVEVRAFSHVEGAVLEAGSVVGPFARLRPGARLKRGARIGNFVEIKEALVEEDARIGHLAYVGDARVGARANIGAGAITCNYDGASKSRTDIGADAFVGSNAALVAPVRIGDGAVVGAGSVITSDVGPDALAVGRGRQRTLDGRGRALRERRR